MFHIVTLYRTLVSYKHNLCANQKEYLTLGTRRVQHQYSSHIKDLNITRYLPLRCLGSFNIHSLHYGSMIFKKSEVTYGLPFFLAV